MGNMESASCDRCGTPQYASFLEKCAFALTQYVLFGMSKATSFRILVFSRIFLRKKWVDKATAEYTFLLYFSDNTIFHYVVFTNQDREGLRTIK